MHIIRIGYLSSGNTASEAARARGIRAALRDLGYIAGQNIAIEFRYGEGKIDWAAKHASELVRLKVDLILVTGGEVWTRAAKKATQTIPIVMTGMEQSAWRMERKGTEEISLGETPWLLRFALCSWR
jgi:ABC-type uncharacterized transport system substrate-binding protein